MSKQNLLLVCIDCLRSDLFHDNQANTPFIDKLQEQGVLFSNMHTTANTTTPAVASFLSGTYSETNGVHSLRNASFSPEVDSLAERLSQQGYTTHAAVTGPLTRETDLDRGFDTYEYRDKDTEVVDEYGAKVEEIISETIPPYFIYLHLWELHHPINVSPEFDSIEHGRIPYERKMSEIDNTLERLVESTPTDTIIAIVGDHGEGLTWRGTAIQYMLNRLRTRYRFESGFDTRKIERLVNIFLSNFSIEIRDHPIENGHGECVYDFVSQVPFLLYNTSLQSSHQEVQCRHIDILPTLLDLLDMPADSPLDGESLLPIGDLEDRPAYIRSCGSTLHGKKNWGKAIRSQGYKYIEYPERDWPPELYDLDDDPTELRPITDSEVIDDLQSKLPRQRLEKVRELNNEERLRDLGYL